MDEAPQTPPHDEDEEEEKPDVSNKKGKLKSAYLALQWPIRVRDVCAASIVRLTIRERQITLE